MAMVCTVCRHESRPLIDRMIAGRSAPLRKIAEQFGLSATAVHRHQDHIVKSVQRAVARRQTTEDTQVASKWMERLDNVYSSAAKGVARAEAIEGEGWEHGAKFLASSLKAIELGLRADGVIEGGAITSTSITHNTQYVIALPRGPGEHAPEVVRQITDESDIIDVSAIESDTCTES